MQGEKQAAKHTDISIRAKQIAESCSPQYDVYIATYTAGKTGQIYQRIEEKSDEEFWSIKAWTPPPHHRLKDPDMLVGYQDQAKFVVEVKWGAIPGNRNTDLILGPDEWRKMRALLTGANMCRIRGPAVKDHRRYRSAEFTIKRDYYTNSETKLILVTDLWLMERLQPEQYAEVLSTWKNAESNILIADINTHVDGIPSFREILDS